MIIYKDLISGDELFTDAYPLKLVDDCMYEVEGKLTTMKGGIDEALIGGNASADGQNEDEGCADGDVSGINIVLANRLQPTPFDKKSYQIYIKGYMTELKKRLQESKPERVDAFMKGAQSRVKWILQKFDDLQFYTGENMNPEGMAVILDYREDGITPYLCFFKDGLLEEKV